MSQFNDAPERDDNEIGNDSASEVAGSVRNLSNTAQRYNEGQKAQNNSGSSEDKSDNNGDSDNKSDSNNSEKPNSSDNKDTPNESGNSKNTVEDNPISSDFSNNFSNNSPDNSNGGNKKTATNNKNNKNGQTPTNSQDSSQDPNNPDGENNQPENNQQNNTPQNNNAGNGPKVSSGPKPGDVAGESGGASTNAGTIKPPSSAETGSQAASQGAQAAQQGAEAAKQAGEVAQAAAEGAAEGSVVPGAGTVAVAAAKVAWASRHTIAKLFMVIVLVIAILSSAIESLPGVIWQMAFDGKENGEQYESVEEIYDELALTVQDFVNTEYTKSMNEAIGDYDNDKTPKIEVDGKIVNLNELNTPVFGDGLGDETTDAEGNKIYKYTIGSDICEIIATFTVKCKLENISPTKENFKKYLEKSAGKLFDKQVESSFKKEVDGKLKDVPLKKIVYEEYTRAPEYKLSVLEDTELPLTTAALKGFWWEPKNQKFINELKKNSDISVEEYETLCSSYNTVAKVFYEYSSSDGSVHFQVEGNIANIEYHNFKPIGGDVSDTRTSVSTYSTNAYYERSKTEIISSEDYDSENTGKVDDGKFRYIITNKDGIDTAERDKNVIQPTGLSGFYLVKRDQIRILKDINDYGIGYKKVTVSSLKRNALLECFKIDKSKPFPLIADYSEEEITKDDGTTEKKWNVSQNYTPEEFTCGMAISSYEEILRNYLYGSNSEIIQIAPATPVVRYEILVTSSGNKVSGARVVVKYKGKKVATVKTNSDGIAVYEGKEGREYEFVVSSEYSKTITSKMSYGNFITDDSSGFILPFQTTSKKQYLKVTSEFGNRVHPVTGKSTSHGGMDIIVKESDEVGKIKDSDPSITQGYPIRAVADGEVIYSGEGSGYGYYVWLQHEGGCQTLYAHCSVLCVKSGDDVVQGQIIAYAGNTGTSTGPHLHFETRFYEDGKYKRKNPRDSFLSLLSLEA